MIIKTKDGHEVSLNAEELRHFKINNASDVVSFLEAIRARTTVGYKPIKDKK